MHACRDVSRVWLARGSPAFLWCLTQLTCLRMRDTRVGSWLQCGGQGGRCVPVRVDADAMPPAQFQLAGWLHLSTANFLILHPVPCSVQPGHFDGLSALVQLAELDASKTRFDNDCCRQLVQLTRLRTIK